MLYDIAFLIFSIFYLPKLIFKKKLRGNFSQRLGFYDKAKAGELESGAGSIWIQAVSVGEVSLCKSLIPLLKRRFPQSKIVISTITKTGNELAKKLFSDKAVIIYFPLDLSFIVKRAVKFIRPKIYIMVETEIWPNLLRALSRSSVPAVIINGRISDASYGKYRLARPFLKKTFNRISFFCMQSNMDAERIMSLGAAPDRVRVTGNMKFDTESKADTSSAQAMSVSLGMKAGDLLIVAGSTHKGEEEAILSVFRALAKEFNSLKLLIAPRHVERAGEVKSLLNNADNGRILVLDRIGLLNSAYSIATLVFIGGSLVGHGGQNPIEPAVFEKPVIFGPHMFNFKDVVSLFIKKGAAIQVKDKDDLGLKISALLKDGAWRHRLGSNAKKIVSENRGATEKNLNVITRFV